MLISSLLVAALCSLGTGRLVERNLRVHETRPTVPTGFTRVGSADATTVLDLRLGLVSSNIDDLIEMLYLVSTPSSPLYGHFLSNSEAAALLGPSNESIHAVNAWLAENNIDATTSSGSGDWLAISLPVSQANEMFDTDFAVYTHDESGDQFIRAMQYSIPEDLINHLQVVHPVTTFLAYPSKPATRVENVEPPSTRKRQLPCPDCVTPAYLQALYGIPNTTAQNPEKLVVTGHFNESPSVLDAEVFLYYYRPDYSIPQPLWQHEEIDDGLYNTSDPGLEANMDTQYTLGLASGVPVDWLSVGNSTGNEPGLVFLDTANYILSNMSNISVVTTSYGGNEAGISVGVYEKLCYAYAAVGATGTSVLFSSGDGGVAGNQDTNCTHFLPTFPSGCPYVTSVGSTNRTGPEVAASFSSGGFSTYWGIPKYQASAVSAYLAKLGDTYSGLYDVNGRGYPDVSTQGVNFMIIVNQTFEIQSGTSFSAPTFASIIALLNDERLNAGKSKLGWLNPWLYSNADALNDITSGDNPGCGTNGFFATTGWDPVTGLGTPNYTALRAAAGL